jgi:hypothetical protein
MAFKMHSIGYHFGRLASANNSSRARSPIVLDLVKEKKRPVAIGRPRKMPPGQEPSTQTQLVEYSSTSESENETEIVNKDKGPKHLRKMYSKQQKKKLFLTMQGIMVLERLPGVSRCITPMLFDGRNEELLNSRIPTKGSTCVDKGEN